MIEVEIRGRLTEKALVDLKKFLEEHGKHVESHDREMILLRDYSGYSKDFVGRKVDIRLRNTDGKCEIMLKKKVLPNDSDSRSELSLALQDTSLDNAKEVMKALGQKSGILMHRSKDVYIYRDIEWSLVRTPKGHYYYEAEVEIAEGSDIEKIRENLIHCAQELGLEVLTPKQTREFIHMLDTKVNEEIVL